MAITWDVKITTLDVAKKEASIMATRIDNTDPQNVLTEIHTIISAVLDTDQQKLDALNTIWDLHLKYQKRQTDINNYIGNLEMQAKANLEARE